MGVATFAEGASEATVIMTRSPKPGLGSMLVSWTKKGKDGRPLTMQNSQLNRSSPTHSSVTPARTVGNQQNLDTLRPERSGVGLRSRKLPDGPIVLSSPFDV